MIVVSQIVFCILPHGLSATKTQDVDGSKYCTEAVWLLCMYIPTCIRNVFFCPWFSNDKL